jgi:hypothetical protein
MQQVKAELAVAKAARQELEEKLQDAVRTTAAAEKHAGELQASIQVRYARTAARVYFCFIHSYVDIIVNISAMVFTNVNCANPHCGSICNRCGVVQ